LSQIYVASLADYNAGTLHGVWIDLNDHPDEDSVMEVVEAMLAESPEMTTCQWCGNTEDGTHIGHAFMGGNTEEWEIHDFQDWPGEINPTKYTLRSLVQISQAVAQYGNAYLAWVQDNGEVEVEAFEEVSFDTYDDAEDFGESWAEAMMNLDDTLGFIQYHVDWKGVGEDLLQDYAHTEYDGKLYVWNN
jgi:antirestriction protein